MATINGVIKIIRNPRLIIFYFISSKPMCYWLSDEHYLKLKCWCRLRYIINLKNPQTFNEKMQWLKLYAHKPLYVTLADKYAVKDYVANIIGSKYVVPCLGVWNNANEIDFEKLPNQFVLKCTHNSGGGIICANKDELDVKTVRKKLNQSLLSDYSRFGRDKQYKGIPRRIIADEFLDDGRTGELQDYKWWCVNGTPKIMYMTNKGKKIEENFYDMDFNVVNINHSCGRRKPEYGKPVEFEEMKELAAKLSKGIPFVRIDFFDVEGKVYFAEYTFFDWGGMRPFDSYETDLKLGNLIELPNVVLNQI